MSLELHVKASIVEFTPMFDFHKLSTVSKFELRLSEKNVP